MRQVYGFDKNIASYIPSMIFIGMCFGAPLLSLIAEKTGSYLGSIIGAGICMLITFIALVSGILTISTMTVSFVVVGVASVYQILAIYRASTYIPEYLVGLTTAVANMIIMSFGYAFHSIIGYIIEVYGSEGASKAFTYGVSAIPIALAVGTVGFIILSYADRKSEKI